MGVLFRHPVSGEWQVLEATSPVRTTPLHRWIERGVGGHYVVKRLEDPSVLTSEALERMEEIGRSFLGKPYDWAFSWDDDRLYCSELAWKIYDRGAGVQIGRHQRLRELDVTDSIVAAALDGRYGDDIPWDEIIISPEAMFGSERLEEVERR